LDLAEFFELIDNTRQEVAESLVRKYLMMQPLLVKVEEIVVGTSTGKA
jgi:dynein heavy chain